MKTLANLTAEVLQTTSLDELHEFSTAGEPSLVVQLVRMFEEFAPQRMVRIRAALAVSNTATIKAEAHSFKSTSANLGARRLSEICAILESVADQITPAELSTLVDRLQLELEAAQLALRQAVRKFA